MDISIYQEILKICDKDDLYKQIKINELNKSSIEVISKQAKELNIEMSVFKVAYSFDKTKCKIYYTADSRVDFRDLIKVLSKLLKARIEMKQVGARDKAKVIGGLGICGLKLCCSTFLNSFDGISISMAKNQMLAINIPKLSGQCGKLICCLKYEDVNYTKLHPLFPKIGTQIKYLGQESSVNSVNMLNSTVTLFDGTKYTTLSLQDYNRVVNGTYTIKQENDNTSITSSFGIDISSSNNNKNNKENKNNKYQNNNGNNNNHNNYNNNNKHYHKHFKNKNKGK